MGSGILGLLRYLETSKLFRQYADNPGFQNPPMYGDFEAQRHWMEVTQQLPLSKWYFYDLQYWGLDYPPLTAYHSWVLGKSGSLIHPEWFALDASRGIETSDLKMFMRASVILSEYLIYVPAAVILCLRYTELHGNTKWESNIALTALLMQPATMLIDHGHFQYNTVMLGFVLAMTVAFVNDRYAVGCVYFVAALCFKQMALYYAPAVFAYLLGVCFFPELNIARFCRIAVSTALSFGITFGPLLLGAWYEHGQDGKIGAQLDSPELLALISGVSPISLDHNSSLYAPTLHLTQVIHRIFPFARGLFEDKVANAWCSIHTLYKLHHLPTTLLSRISLLVTLAAITPACIVIFLKPSKQLFPYALASCAWGFFLFSFQVHEKSVLLPLLPMTFLLAGPSGLGAEMRAWLGWANMLATWTLFPLLERDELRIPYAVLTLLWAYLMGLPPTSVSLYTTGAISSRVTIVHGFFYVAMLGWHALEAFVLPPDSKPDLWVVLNCLVGAAGFAICYLWCTWTLVEKSGLLSLPTSTTKEPAAALSRTTRQFTPLRAGRSMPDGISNGTPRKRKS